MDDCPIGEQHRVGTSVAQLIRILTASIAPVIVISGVGLLLLSMTNRHVRVIDRRNSSLSQAMTPK